MQPVQQDWQLSVATAALNKSAGVAADSLFAQGMALFRKAYIGDGNQLAQQAGGIKHSMILCSLSCNRLT